MTHRIKANFGAMFGFALAALVTPVVAQPATTETAKDALYRSTGDHKRFYDFAAAGIATPARVYVPTGWDIKKASPLVIILHGANLTEDAAFDREPADLKGIIKREADKHGFIVVAPLGYKGGGVGLFSGTGPTAAAKAEADAQTARMAQMAASGMSRPPPPLPGAADTKDNALAEQDVLSIIDAVTKEYNIDRSRIYVMGNSIPGTGSWAIAIDHPELFAAISPSAAGVFSTGYPYERLRGMEVRMVVGEHDGGVATMRETAAAVKQAGVSSELVEVPGGDHGNAWYMALPGTFDFFARYARK